MYAPYFRPPLRIFRHTQGHSTTTHCLAIVPGTHTQHPPIIHIHLHLPVPSAISRYFFLSLFLFSSPPSGGYNSIDFERTGMRWWWCAQSSIHRMTPMVMVEDPECSCPWVRQQQQRQYVSYIKRTRSGERKTASCFRTSIISPVDLRPTHAHPPSHCSSYTYNVLV